MADHRPGEGAAPRTWLDRLIQLLSNENEPQNRGELIQLLRDAEQRNLFDAEALAMIEGALQVSEMQVRDIMVPRSQMVMVEADSAPENFITRVIESGHSRFPVSGDNRDEVLGILLAKDLLEYFSRGSSRDFDLDDLMRPAVFVPESKRLNVLLREFRSSRNHMALVADEYGGVSGLVTIEDVLEQIVGEIDDEHDVDEGRYIKRHKNGQHTIKAHIPIEDFNEYFSTSFSAEEFDTVAGLIVKSFGHLPTRGEQVNVGDIRFEVLRADKRRVRILRVL